ncbi:MAG: 3-deoxy-D-manno-octulosonic acid transferase [Aquificaceae bacterium]
MEKGKGRLWVHTASVGEFNTIKPLLKRLYPKYEIVVTYFSFRARDYLKAQEGKAYFHKLYRLPIDLPPFVISFERKIKPIALLIMERELWPSLLTFTKASKVWLNAYAKGGLLERCLSKSFSLIITRDELSAERFKGYGCKRVLPCGNLKFVLEDPKPVSLKVNASKLIVAGSTHQGEEAIIKKAFDLLRKDFKDLRLIVAPRHIKRAKEVAAVFEGYKVSFRSSQEEGWDVLVLDSLGELFSLYAYADAAVVGGTFVPVGGHNLLEPAYFGKPVLYGPYTHKVKDLKAFLEEVALGFPVKDERELYIRLKELFFSKPSKEPFSLKELSQRTLECYLSALEGVI